ncbi:NUMOD4 domain-containing protein [Chryseobacterium sp.]|uniref:NUMOD4 domain-containing protein n=1 Tax=Chryseobacterium sp. TaxID=1871047 RepID=UPI0024E22D3C|nr:NUMOD4 domain-containing protein [Chryseobacterium sp.]
MNEIWKPIKDYEGLYEASNMGRIKSVERVVKRLNRYKTYTNQIIPEKIKKGSPDKDGYLKVGLWKNNKCLTTSIHRIIANTFLDNPDVLPQVNHVDEDKQNNCVANLEWCSPIENINHGTGMLRSRLSNIKPVLQFDMNGTYVRTWDNYFDAAKHYNVSFKAISQAVRKKICSAGYQWRKIKIGDNIKPIEPYKNKSHRVIYQFTKDGQFIEKHESISEASKKYSIDKSSISHNAIGNKKSAGGYVWSYEENGYSLNRL